MEDLFVVDLCPDLKGEELPSCEADVGCSELPQEQNGLARDGIVSLGIRVFAKILVFIGLTHSILEGYFTFSPEFWKEYNKGDSRYAGRDVAIVVIEGITSVLEGLASLLAMLPI